MKKVTIVKKSYRQVWNKTKIVVEDDSTKNEFEVNMFHDISPEWITIYDTEGGTGTGFYKGDILHRIYIGDAEITTITEKDN